MISEPITNHTNPSRPPTCVSLLALATGGDGVAQPMRSAFGFAGASGDGATFAAPTVLADVPRVVDINGPKLTRPWLANMVMITSQLWNMCVYIYYITLYICMTHGMAMAS